MTMMSDLTGDLVEEILCRVSATSLKRLRSTCKLWNSLFQDKRFASKHFDKAAKQIIFLTLNNLTFHSMSINLPSVEIRGELSLIDPYDEQGHTFEIYLVFHCDGLLLCTNATSSRIVLWNPLTGQTRQIQPRDNVHKSRQKYALGSYKDSKSGKLSYKILSFYRYYGYPREFAIYDIKSNSWRVLDVTLDSRILFTTLGVSLKGKTYWFATDKEKHIDMLLVSFDYTTERFGRQHLRFLCPKVRYKHIALSVVREEKISVLLQHDSTSNPEIWVTNKIDDEAKVVSWSKVLAVDLKFKLDSWYVSSFVVDEEKKVLVCCDQYLSGKSVVYIVGEDNKVRQMDFGSGSNWSFSFTYAPSLTQIQQGVGCKRKRGQ